MGKFHWFWQPIFCTLAMPYTVDRVEFQSPLQVVVTYVLLVAAAVAVAVAAAAKAQIPNCIARVSVRSTWILLWLAILVFICHLPFVNSIEMKRFLWIVLAVYLFAGDAQCIIFHLMPNAQKCLTEDIQGNELVMGEYEASVVPGQQISYIVSFVNANCGVCTLGVHSKDDDDDGGAFLEIVCLISSPNCIAGTRLKGRHSITEGAHRQGQIQFHVGDFRHLRDLLHIPSAKT